MVQRKRTGFLLLVGVVVVVSAMSALYVANPWMKGADTLIRELEKRVEDGDTRAMNELGSLYENGKGVNRDPDRAFDLYLQAAKQGEAIAQTNVGVCYENGTGVPKDIKEAIRWYEMAASQGHVEAQRNLAALYFNGTQVSQDYRKAIEWTARAAESGNVEAQSMLGVMYQEGLGTFKDPKLAMEWHIRAGTADSLARLGNMYFSGDGVEKNYKQAFDLYMKASKKGHPEATYNLGVMYEKGLHITPDLIVAGNYYQRAAELGLQVSKNYLSGLHDFCMQDTTIDLQQAQACMISAPAGYVESQRYVGSFFHSGTFVKQDYTKAIAWSKKAAEQGDIQSQILLATSYQLGNGVPRSEVESYAWFYAAIQGVSNDPAITKLQEMARYTSTALLEKMSEMDKKKAVDRAAQIAESVKK